MSTDRATADDHQRASELKNLGMLDASSLRKCYRTLSAEYFAAERKKVELEAQLRQEREAARKTISQIVTESAAKKAVIALQARVAQLEIAISQLTAVMHEAKLYVNGSSSSCRELRERIHDALIAALKSANTTQNPEEEAKP